jgi:putative Mg2+ transporter-C (MgtC) family protein
MSLALSWPEIAVRILLACVSGGLIGWNRTERGRAAGVRTTILVSLAACISMIQVNLLLGLTGKAANSFIVMDLMRLPLGILSGMGFIGAGAILRRNNMVIGVTTAATLWFVTVAGLCFGGGQIVLGAIGSVLGFAVLAGLRPLERRAARARQGMLIVGSNDTESTYNRVIELLGEDGFTVTSCGLVIDAGSKRNELRCRVSWIERANPNEIPRAIRVIQQLPGISQVVWTPGDQ